MNNGNDEKFFSNSVEMAIFKIKIGLWKNTLFQFGEISGYLGPSILYTRDTIAKKNCINE